MSWGRKLPGASTPSSLFWLLVRGPEGDAEQVLRGGHQGWSSRPVGTSYHRRALPGPVPATTPKSRGPTLLPPQVVAAGAPSGKQAWQWGDQGMLGLAKDTLGRRHHRPPSSGQEAGPRAASAPPSGLRAKGCSAPVSEEEVGLGVQERPGAGNPSHYSPSAGSRPSETQPGADRLT